jgi:hypothetical protein
MKRFMGSLALIGTVLLGPGALPQASALDGRGFSAYAEATTINFQYGIPGFILTDKYTDDGGPTAQALFQSAGSKLSSAQLPYIGFLADYPGLFATATVQYFPNAPQLPAYPGRAQADADSQPESTAGQESSPYFLKAKAANEAVSSIARFGPAPGAQGSSAPSSLAKTDIATTDDSVSVLAETIGQSFSLGPLSVSDMHAKSVTSYAKGATDVVTKTELFVKGVAAGSTAFTFGPDGLKVAQNGVPVAPGKELTSLNKALAPMGLEILFASSRNLPGGGASAAFEVVQTHPVPGGGEGRQGIFRIRFGGVISQISLGS